MQKDSTSAFPQNTHSKISRPLHFQDRKGGQQTPGGRDTWLTNCSALTRRCLLLAGRMNEKENEVFIYARWGTQLLCITNPSCCPWLFPVLDILIHCVTSKKGCNPFTTFVFALQTLYLTYCTADGVCGRGGNIEESAYREGNQHFL